MTVISKDDEAFIQGHDFFSPAIFLNDFRSKYSIICACDLITYPDICHPLCLRGGGHVSANY